MHAAILVACSDDGQNSMLSTNTRMEFFIFGLYKVDDIRGSQDNPGVTCDGNGEFKACRWAAKNASGTWLFFHAV